MTITEFLLARIAEDVEAAWGAMHPTVYPDGVFGETAAEESLRMAEREGCSGLVGEHFERWMPARALAECQAKRRIVDEHQPSQQHPYEVNTGTPMRCCTCGQVRPRNFPCETIRALASIYTYHPDYRW